MPQMAREPQPSCGNSKNNERPSEALKRSGNIHRYRSKLTPQFEPKTMHTIRVVTSKLSGVRTAIGERSFSRHPNEPLPLRLLHCATFTFNRVTFSPT